MTTPKGRVSIAPVMTAGGDPLGPPKPPPDCPPPGAGDLEHAVSARVTASKVSRNRVTVSMMRGLLIKECPASRGADFSLFPTFSESVTTARMYYRNLWVMIRPPGRVDHLGANQQCWRRFRLDSAAEHHGPPKQCVGSR